MVAVGRDLWGSSSPTPLPKQVHLEKAAQDLILIPNLSLMQPLKTMSQENVYF